MWEVEAKAPARNLDAIAAELMRRGASLLADRREHDVYFAAPDRNFAQTDEALRLRTVDNGTILTYKGPKIDPMTKTRRELSVEVDDAIAVAALLDALGYRRVGTVVKHRRCYQLGSSEVSLDDVEGLGTFVEVEEIAETETERDRARERILAFLSALGLERTERRSYLELLLERGAAASPGTFPR